MTSSAAAVQVVSLQCTAGILELESCIFAGTTLWSPGLLTRTFRNCYLKYVYKKHLHCNPSLSLSLSKKKKKKKCSQHRKQNVSVPAMSHLFRAVSALQHQPAEISGALLTYITRTHVDQRARRNNVVITLERDAEHERHAASEVSQRN